MNWASSMTTSGREQYDQYLAKPLEVGEASFDYEPSGSPIENVKVGGVSSRVRLTKSGQIVGVENDWDSYQGSNFTYSASNEIQVTGLPVEGNFQVGDRIRIRQAGAYKYFFLVSTPPTNKIRVQGGDYTVANAPIEELSVSRLSTPAGMTTALSYTTAVSVNSGATSIAYQQCTFYVEGSVCTLNLNISLGATTGVPSSYYFTLPFTYLFIPSASLPSAPFDVPVYYMYSGNDELAHAIIDSADPTKLRIRPDGLGSFSLKPIETISTTLVYSYR